MGVTTTADLTQRQISYSPTINTGPFPINQGTTDLPNYNPVITQGSADPVITDPTIQQGQTSRTPIDSNIIQGETDPLKIVPTIEQGITSPTLTDYQINQGGLDPVIPNINVQQGGTDPIIPTYNIQQGFTDPVLSTPNIQQGGTDPLPISVNLNQGSTTPISTDYNIEQGGTDPLLTNYNIQQGNTDPIIPNVNIQQGATEPIPSNPTINQGGVDPVFTNYNIQQGSTTPIVSNPTINQGSTDPELVDYNIQQGGLDPVLTNYNIEQGSTDPVLTDYNIEQGSTEPVLTTYNIQQGSTDPVIPDPDIQQGSTTPVLTDYNIQQGSSDPVLTDYNIQQGSTDPVIPNPVIEQGSTDPVLTNYTIEQGSTDPILTNSNIEQGSTDPIIPNPTINQGGTSVGGWNPSVNQGSTSASPFNPKISQGGTTVAPSNITLDQGSTDPVLPVDIVDQGDGSVVIVNRGIGLQPSLAFANGQEILLATSPIFSQTAPASAPIVGGASLASLVTGGIGAIAAAGGGAGFGVASQVVSIAAYLGALPLSLYRRPEGALLIGAQVAETTFSHVMSRKNKLFDTSDGAVGSLDIDQYKKAGVQYYITDGSRNEFTFGLDTATKTNQDPDVFDIKSWSIPKYAFVDKFRILVGYSDDPNNINNQLIKNPIQNFSLGPNTGDTQDVSDQSAEGPIIKIHNFRPSNKFLSDDNLSELRNSGNTVEAGNIKIPSDDNTTVGGILTPNGHKGWATATWEAGNYVASTLTYDAISARAATSIESKGILPDSLRIPGSIDFSTDTKEILKKYRDLRTVDFKNVNPTDTNADANAPVDPIYSSNSTGATKRDDGTITPFVDDFIKLYFVNKRNNEAVQFRAYLEDFSDKFSHNWTDVNYVGRPNTLKLFNNVSRDINISFIVPALSRGELKYVYHKLERLTKFSLPTGIGIMRGPVVTVTVGDWFVNELCVIESLDFQIDQEYPWEINVEKDTVDVGELPQIVKVSLGLKVIGNTPMNDNYAIFGTSITSNI